MERELEYGSAPRVRLVEVEQVGPSAVAEGLANAKKPQDVYAILKPLIGSKDRERFVVMHLDSRYCVVSVEVISKGTLSSAVVHPREVFKGAFLSNAAAIITAHNHPSGDLTPSAEDHEVLKRLHDAGKLLGVPMLDFLIVSSEHFKSLRETSDWPLE